MEVVAITLKNRVRFDLNLHVQITGRAPIDACFTLSSKTDAVPFVNPCRDFDR
mgnify:CR=1 FL=1